jgi:poly(3-hydroxyalkanoate) synthetase
VEKHAPRATSHSGPYRFAYEHIDDLAYLAKKTFEGWYEDPLDLPGCWYLQAITQLFKKNRLVKEKFAGPGRKLDRRDITCPTYLLAGPADDIATPEQVVNAAHCIGMPKDRIVQEAVPGGRIGLFVGGRTLKEHWPRIARWIADQ